MPDQLVPVVLVVPVVPVVDPPAPAATAAPRTPATGAISGAKLVTPSPAAGTPPFANQVTQMSFCAAVRFSILLSRQRHCSWFAFSGFSQDSCSTAEKAGPPRDAIDIATIKFFRTILKQPLSPKLQIFILPQNTIGRYIEASRQACQPLPFRQNAANSQFSRHDTETHLR